MGLNRVTSISVHPGRQLEFQQRVAELALAASEQGDPWHWTVHETLYGERARVHFATRAESFEEIDAQGRDEELWLRALGEHHGRDAMLCAQKCIASVERTLSLDRPDLSFTDDIAPPEEFPYSSIVMAHAKPEQAEGCEELIRKVAEAIPKLGLTLKLFSSQVMFGAHGTYWTLRPVRRLADLDEEPSANELLHEAFGAVEAGLIWRHGMASLEAANRELVAYRPELSNPGRH